LEYFGRFLKKVNSEMIGWYEHADVALKMLESYPTLPTESLQHGFNAFHELARLPCASSNITRIVQAILDHLTDSKNFIFLSYFFFLS